MYHLGPDNNYKQASWESFAGGILAALGIAGLGYLIYRNLKSKNKEKPESDDRDSPYSQSSSFINISTTPYLFSTSNSNKKTKKGLVIVDPLQGRTIRLD